MIRGAALAVVLLLPGTMAQDHAGLCVEADPCTWVVTTGAEGFLRNYTQANLTLYVGEWFVIEGHSNDTWRHVISWQNHSMAIEAGQSNVSAPFQIGAEAIQLEDARTGDEIVIRPEVWSFISGHDDTSPTGGSADDAGDESDGGQRPRLIFPIDLALVVAAIGGFIWYRTKKKD